MVIVGTDMRGMSEQDDAAVAARAQRREQSRQVFEVLEQGISNYIALARRCGPRSRRRCSSTRRMGSRSLVDPDRVYY